VESQDIVKIVSSFVVNSPDNRVKENVALSDSVFGIKIFDDPIFGFGDADDNYFQLFKNPSIVGNHFKTPQEWLPEAKTVISFFFLLPFISVTTISFAVKKCFTKLEGVMYTLLLILRLIFPPVDSVSFLSQVSRTYSANFCSSICVANLLFPRIVNLKDRFHCQLLK